MPQRTPRFRFALNTDWTSFFRFGRFVGAASALLTMSLAATSFAQTTTFNSAAWRYGDGHAGANTQETVLTPANVTAGSFGKLFSVAVDGYVYAQPLYMSALKMPNGTVHNVMFVATEHDSVYAFDADSNGGANAQPLWQASMLSTTHGAAAGATTLTSDDVATTDITPEVGITSTPVINPATNTLYLIAATKENGNYVQRLHALNILTGAEQPHSPVAIAATVKGTGNGSSGGELSFSPAWQNNRGALSYFNGYVYAAFGSHGDNGPYHGWVLAYNATTLGQTGALCLSPSGSGAGVWGGGAALPIDPTGSGSLFLSTGNGDMSTYPPITAATDFGDSVVKVSLANGGLTVVDAFTPSNEAYLNSVDRDEGSGGVLLLPTQQGKYPNLVIQEGKAGNAFVLNRNGMGGFLANSEYNANAVQEIYDASGGLWSTPAYWNGSVYMWGTNDYLKEYSLDSGLLSERNTAAGTIHSDFPGATPSISANGNENGIVWAVDSELYYNNGAETLYAYNASDISQVLYASNAVARDDAGQANKFSTPVVANGKVYVSAAYQVNVYGLLNGATDAAAPTISPAGGSFTTAQKVQLSSATANATIYYTLDGSTPTPSSTEYTGPVTISADTVLKALASAPGYLQSSVSSASFNFASQTPVPAINPSGGSIGAPQQVTITDSDADAVIYYTTNGSTPTASSTVYKGAFTVSASTTIEAIAIDPKLAASDAASSVFTYAPQSNVINFPEGFASTTGLTLNGNTIATDDSRLQLTTGLDFETGSVFFNTPVNVQSFTTDFSFQLSDAVADGFTFTLQNTGVTAYGGEGAELGYGTGSGRTGIGKSVAIKFDFHNNAGEGNDSTGLYTNGATPTIPAVDITPSGIELSSGDTIAATLTYNGTTLVLTMTDLVTEKVFTTSFLVNIPQIVGASTAYVGFTGGSGGDAASQKIVSWTYAESALQVSNAAANKTVAEPTFTLNPAASNLGVALQSTTTGATIYYTVDGSEPTHSSKVYKSPVIVSGTSLTIKAFASATGYTDSPVVTGSYRDQ